MRVDILEPLAEWRERGGARCCFTLSPRSLNDFNVQKPILGMLREAKERSDAILPGTGAAIFRTQLLGA